MELYKNTVHLARHAWDPRGIHAGCYLRVTEGTWFQVQYVGESGEEIGWLYGRDLATGCLGWFPSATLQPLGREGQMMSGRVGMALRDSSACFPPGFPFNGPGLGRGARVESWRLHFDMGDYVLISYEGPESSDDEGWLYGCLYRRDDGLRDGTRVSRWGWIPKSFVGLTSALNDHLWLTSSLDQPGGSQAAGDRVLVLSCCTTESQFCLGDPDCRPDYLAAGFVLDVLDSSDVRQTCMQRAGTYEHAIALLSARDYKACVISEFLEPPSEFLAALSTWVWNGGNLLMASGHDDCYHWRHEEPVYGDQIAREYFGKTWSISGAKYDAEYAPAAYNSAWIMSRAYDDLGGRIDSLYPDLDGDGNPIGDETALLEVPPAERAFQMVRAGECAVAAGRFGKGLVSVSAYGWWEIGDDTELPSKVLLTIARIPSAVIWSEVRYFFLAVTESNGMRRAAPASKSGIIHRFCSLQVPLARLILTFAFGPVHVPACGCSVIEYAYQPS